MSNKQEYMWSKETQRELDRLLKLRNDAREVEYNRINALLDDFFYTDISQDDLIDGIIARKQEFLDALSAKIFE